MRTIFIEDRKEIDAIIKSCKICHVARAGENVPYVLPMNFALGEDAVVLHSAQSGRMWELLQQNPKVCINWTTGDDLAWQDAQVGCSYRMQSKSVLVEGPVEFVDAREEKEACLRMIMAQYSDRAFKFNAPAVKNVGIIKVGIEKISAKAFGVRVGPRSDR